jgi:hypothetical protein
MIKKIISFFIALSIILLPTSIRAQEGRVTSLALDEPAPYAGILLDPLAASKMIVDQKYLKIETELTVRKEFQKELAEKRLAFDLLKIEHDSLKKIHEQTILIKNKQIEDLNELLKEEMGDDYTGWWIAGGVVVGIALSIATFYASVEISK